MGLLSKIKGSGVLEKAPTIFKQNHPKIFQQSTPKPSKNQAENDLEKTLNNIPKMRHMAPKMGPFGTHGLDCFRLRGVFLATPFLAPPRGHPWSRFGSNLGPFWVHLGSILVPFGTLLLPFCPPWVYFGTLRSL